MLFEIVASFSVLLTDHFNGHSNLQEYLINLNGDFISFCFNFHILLKFPLSPSDSDMIMCPVNCQSNLQKECLCSLNIQKVSLDGRGRMCTSYSFSVAQKEKFHFFFFQKNLKKQKPRAAREYFHLLFPCSFLFGRIPDYFSELKVVGNLQGPQGNSI